MSEKKHLCICGNEYSHASGLSKHRKVCRDVIIEEFKRTEQNKAVVIEPTTIYSKKRIIDYLTDDCKGAPENAKEWINGIANFYTVSHFDQVIDGGLTSWKEIVISYIELLNHEEIPIRISNKQLGSRFKLYYKENGKWIELQGKKATDYYLENVIRRMSRHMAHNIFPNAKRKWMDANPYWDIGGEDEKRYMALRDTFGYGFEEKMLPKYGEELMEYFLISKKNADEDYI
jgi:hypothetical protein